MTTNYAMLLISAAMTDQYFVDSGCTQTIVCSTKYMKNLCEIQQLLVKGLSWYKVYNLEGGLHFQINDNNYIQRELIMKAVLYYPAGNINLIATDDLNATNWDDNEASPTTHTALVQLGTVGKLSTLPLGPQSDSNSCFHARCCAASVSLEELIHECMAHAPIQKLPLMSLQAFFEAENITLRYSNPHEQFGNRVSEKFVDTLGKLMHTLLLQSHLPPEFWGAAAHYATD
eukprot:532398-Rhodomonas_salina.1